MSVWLYLYRRVCDCEFEENGVDLGDFYGDDRRHSFDGWLESYDEVQEHQACIEGNICQTFVGINILGLIYSLNSC